MRRLQRQTRQRRVIEYYRQKISSPDKRLLEQLRDYELALTGRDANWQYYFALRSFRRIDAFISQAPAERLSQIAQFKRDVLAYKRNLDSGRWRDPMEDEPFLSFDEWCQHARIEDSSSATQSGRGSGGLSGDYALFQATPQTPLPAIKRQFRQLALRAHPDITGDDGAAMRRLLAAYERVRAAHRSL